MPIFEPRRPETEEFSGSDAASRALSVTVVENDFVTKVYENIAWMYDYTFGPTLHAGRIQAIQRMGIKAGDRVLEVGVGTGINAGLYPSDCVVTGIDLSEPMLEKARERVLRKGVSNIRLLAMDAADLKFPDNSFDIVYAPYVISVVPDPVAVVREMRRVCRPRRSNGDSQSFPRNASARRVGRPSDLTVDGPYRIQVGPGSAGVSGPGRVEAGVDREGQRAADLVSHHLHQGVSVSRPWLALVLVLFCLPLFIGLRSLDLETDEAIYSFAVDRILEIGDWLQPKSSPSETAVFLEKPPLKFWIVAAPIRAGLLPHDEFGLRFWDALFGGVAFLYVFAIGSLLAGPVCGAVAVMLLFVHWPLLLDHGLRTNNMEGPLFLCYCGGIYHFLRWPATDGRRKQSHAVAVGLYFVLGFMTKFVAALFLPVVLALGALMFRATRVKLASDWRLWLSVKALVILLIVPWFIYAYVQFGSELWETMFAAHVYERFTTGLNQAHVHPWNYYLVMMAEGFSRSGLQWLVPIGVIVLFVQSVRRRSFEGMIVVLWATVPLALISVGSSKLYHYAYPFLPPLTIAAGYVVALVVMLGAGGRAQDARAAEDVIARCCTARAARSPSSRSTASRGDGGDLDRRRPHRRRHVFGVVRIGDRRHCSSSRARASCGRWRR